MCVCACAWERGALLSLIGNEQALGACDGQGGLVCCSPGGCEESYTTERLHFHFSLSYIGEGNGYPLQYSYLENSMDRGAGWATVHGVAKSQIRLSPQYFLWLSNSGSGKNSHVFVETQNRVFIVVLFIAIWNGKNLK